MTSITIVKPKQFAISKPIKNAFAIVGIVALQVAIIYEAMPLAVEIYRSIVCQSC